MSEFKGTKGPWHPGRHGHITSEFGETVCQMFKDNDVKYENNQANAQLISCAPEMLEALKEIIASELLDGTIQGSKIKRLIKKATTICNG